MRNYKWSLGVVALSLSLSACMDMQRSEHMGPQYQESMQHQKQAANETNKPKVAQKTYASKDPTQQATPGPVRKAAPQLPVIQ